MTSDANAWPTPRSWEMASQVLSGIARRQKTQLLSGTSEFEAQLLDGTVNEPESRFGSLVTNVLDLVEILPRLSVNGDADLNRFADQIKERLCNYSAQGPPKTTLAPSPAADAANIVAQMDDVLRSRRGGNRC